MRPTGLVFLAAALVAVPLVAQAPEAEAKARAYMEAFNQGEAAGAAR